MKTLTLHQPWALAMKLGLKTIETRKWATKHRGLLAIHAGKTTDTEQCYKLPGRDPTEKLRQALAAPSGVIGVVELFGVERMTEDLVDTARQGKLHVPWPFGEHLPNEFEWGDWRPGRYAWRTRPVVWFRETISAVGKMGVWDWQEPEDWRSK
jgi:activating signal cointegrator 1